MAPKLHPYRYERKIKDKPMNIYSRITIEEEDLNLLDKFEFIYQKRMELGIKTQVIIISSLLSYKLDMELSVFTNRPFMVGRFVELKWKNIDILVSESLQDNEIRCY